MTVLLDWKVSGVGLPPDERQGAGLPVEVGTVAEGDRDRRHPSAGHTAETWTENSPGVGGREVVVVVPPPPASSWWPALSWWWRAEEDVVEPDGRRCSSVGGRRSQPPSLSLRAAAWSSSSRARASSSSCTRAWWSWSRAASWSSSSPRAAASSWSHAASRSWSSREASRWSSWVADAVAELRHVRLGLTGVEGDHHRAALGVGELGPHVHVAERDRVDADADRVLPGLQALGIAWLAHVLADEDLLRRIGRRRALAGRHRLRCTGGEQQQSENDKWADRYTHGRTVVALSTPTRTNRRRTAR